MVATLPSAMPTGREIPCEPTATRVASVLSASAMSTWSARPSTTRKVASGSTSFAAANAVCASASRCAAASDAAQPACAAEASSSAVTTARLPLGSSSRFAWRAASRLSGVESTPTSTRSRTARPGSRSIVGSGGGDAGQPASVVWLPPTFSTISPFRVDTVSVPAALPGGIRAGAEPDAEKAAIRGPTFSQVIRCYLGGHHVFGVEAGGGRRTRMRASTAT